MERRTVSVGHKKGIPQGMPWKEKVVASIKVA